MKKLLTAFLVCGIVLTFGVSCNPDDATGGNSKGVTSVYIGNTSTTKALSTSASLIGTNEVEKLYWFYTAEKTDGSIHTTGQTTSEKPVKTTSGAPTTGLANSDLGKFSTGSWKFVFKGYTEVSGNTPSGTCVYVAVDSSGNEYVDISLSDADKHLTLTLKMKDVSSSLKYNVTYTHVNAQGKSLKLVITDDATTPASVEKTVIADSSTGVATFTDTLTTPADGTHTYKFAVKYNKGTTTEDWEELGSSTITFNIINGYETTITGSVDDLDTQYKVIIDDVIETVSQTIDTSKDNTVFEAKVTPADAENQTTTVTVPKEVASFTNGSQAELTVNATSSVSTVQAEAFKISDSQSSLGAVTLSVKVNDVEVTQFKDSSDKALAVTVETYVAKNLSNVTITYGKDSDKQTWNSMNGSTVYTESDIAAPTDDKDDGKCYYDPTTGKLVYKTTHFSTFLIGSDEKFYVKSNNSAYKTWAGAIAEIGENDTIILLGNASGDGLMVNDGTKAKDSLTVDFNGYIYTVNGAAVGSEGTASQAMHIGTSIGSVTIKNGTLTVDENAKNVKMAAQIYVPLIIEKMTLNFSEVPVSKYGTYSAESGYAEFSDKEIPLFNNNDPDGTLTFNNCTITMPDKSKTGISAGYKTVLDNTAVNGYVNLQETTDKLVVKNNSTISKVVVSYFDGYAVKMTEAGSVKTYTVSKTTEVEVGNITINNAAELAGFAAKVNEGKSYAGHTVTLGADIDLSDYVWTPIGGNIIGYTDEGEEIRSAFSGTFDGKNHTISNVNCINSDKKSGLFGAVSCGAVKNLTVNTITASGNNHVGGITGYSICSDFDNCHVKNAILTTAVLKNDDGDKAGGICGYFTCEGNGHIYNCSVEDTVITGYRDIGGIVGYAGCYTSTAKETSYIKKCDVKNVTINNDRSQNYKNYDSNNKYDVNFFVGDTSSVPYENGEDKVTDHIDISGNTLSGTENSVYVKTGVKFEESDPSDYLPVGVGYGAKYDDSAKKWIISKLFESGDGTENNPYLISSATEWYNLCTLNACDQTKYPGQYYISHDDNGCFVKLIANIDCSTLELPYSCSVYGLHLDGQGYTISNVTGACIFDNDGSTLYKGNYFTNIKIENCNVNYSLFGYGTKNVAGNTATFEKVTINNCSAKGGAFLYYCGSGTATFKDCNVTNTNIVGGSSMAVGGYVGNISTGVISIDNCTFGGSVVSTGEAAGSFVGQSANYSASSVIIKNSTVLSGTIVKNVAGGSVSAFDAHNGSHDYYVDGNKFYGTLISNGSKYAQGTDAATAGYTAICTASDFTVNADGGISYTGSEDLGKVVITQTVRDDYIYYGTYYGGYSWNIESTSVNSLAKGGKITGLTKITGLKNVVTSAETPVGLQTLDTTHVGEIYGGTFYFDAQTYSWGHYMLSGTYDSSNRTAVNPDSLNVYVKITVYDANGVLGAVVSGATLSYVVDFSN